MVAASATERDDQFRCPHLGTDEASAPITVTQWSANIAQQLLVRHGIVLRETAIAENVAGGYPTIYPALKTMEDGGWVRRGMFVGGLGAAQFAMPAAVDMLRSLRSERDALDVLFWRQRIRRILMERCCRGRGGWQKWAE